MNDFIDNKDLTHLTSEDKKIIISKIQAANKYLKWMILEGFNDATCEHEIKKYISNLKS